MVVMQSASAGYKPIVKYTQKVQQQVTCGHQKRTPAKHHHAAGLQKSYLTGHLPYQVDGGSQLCMSVQDISIIIRYRKFDLVKTTMVSSVCQALGCIPDVCQIVNAQHGRL